MRRKLPQGVQPRPTSGEVLLRDLRTGAYVVGVPSSTNETVYRQQSQSPVPTTTGYRPAEEAPETQPSPKRPGRGPRALASFALTATLSAGVPYAGYRVVFADDPRPVVASVAEDFQGSVHGLVSIGQKAGMVVKMIRGLA